MTERLEFRVHGMDCADEVAILRREIGPSVGGADRLSFDILRGKMIVAAAERNRGAREIAAAVAKTGMRAELWTDVQPGAGEQGFWQRRGRTLLTTLSGVFLSISSAVCAWSRAADRITGRRRLTQSRPASMMDSCAADVSHFSLP